MLDGNRAGMGPDLHGMGPLMRKSANSWRTSGRPGRAGMLAVFAVVCVVGSGLSAQARAKITRFSVGSSTETFVTGVNKSSVTVGYYTDPTTGYQVGFQRAADGTITQIEVPGATNTTPEAINKDG